MLCRKCLKENEQDALFCEQCGSSLGAVASGPPAERTWNARYGILVALVIAAVAAAGYYKFFLPGGIAAEVNGEGITLAEVDGVVRSNADGRDIPPEMMGRMRSMVLSRLITERIAEQEARKAGISAAPEDVAAALERSQAASGLDQRAFEAAVAERYGSLRTFAAALERQLTIRKYLADRVTAGIRDPALSDAAVSRWLQDISSRAVVRVSLADKQSAGGCGCCNSGKGDGASPGAGAVSPRTEAARTAALQYWEKRGGGGPVETRITDLGCHLQIDIIKANTTAASLRYQNGTITEL